MAAQLTGIKNMNTMKTLGMTAISFGIGRRLRPAFAEEVRVYNWSDYIDEESAGKVRRRNGADPDLRCVRFSNEVLETKMLAGGSSGYDVVVPSGTGSSSARSQAGVIPRSWMLRKLSNMRVTCGM